MILHQIVLEIKREEVEGLKKVHGMKRVRYVVSSKSIVEDDDFTVVTQFRHRLPQP